MKSRTLYALVAGALTLSASARQLTPEEALARVDVTSGTLNTPLSITKAPRLVMTTEEDGITTLYAFNRQGGGFMIVSADDDLPVLLLGFSDRGELPADTAEMGPGMKWLLGQYSRSVEMTVKGAAPAQPEDNGTANTRIDVAPLIATRWGQNAPYNDQCPEVDGERCPTGCVATAMAQVMNYHKWPEKGRKSHEYMWRGNFVSMDFSTITFEWDKMLTSYNAESDTASARAVATLMYACGVASSMNYTPNSSGGNYYAASEALINFFDYDRGMRYLSRDYYDIEAWTSLLYGELVAKRPVLYCGSSYAGGHAFIVDGYKSVEGEDYFHLNWGWDGWSDGYFRITELEPTVQGTGGTSSGYNESQNMVIGIQPAREDSHGLPVMEFASGFGFEADTVDRTVPDAQVVVKDAAYIFAQPLVTVYASMGVKLTSATDGRVQYVAAEQKKYIRGQAFNRYAMKASDFPTEGTWTVVPAVRDSLGNWYDEGLVLMNHVRYATLDASAESLIFTEGETADIRCHDLKLLSPVFSEKQFGVSGTITAFDGEYYRNVYVVLTRNGIAVAQGPVIPVQLADGESKVFNWVGKFNRTFAPGQYVIELVESGGEVVSNAVPVTVEATPTAATEVEIYYTYGDFPMAVATEDAPAQASIDPFETTIHITCTSGYFSDILSGCIFRDETGVYEIPGGFVGLKAGQSAEIKLKLTENYISTDVVYNMKTLAEQAQKYIGEPSYFIVSTSGVAGVTTDADRGEPVAYYTLDGVRLAEPAAKGIYIAVYADGTAVKIVR